MDFEYFMIMVTASLIDGEDLAAYEGRYLDRQDDIGEYLDKSPAIGTFFIQRFKVE